MKYELTHVICPFCQKTINKIGIGPHIYVCGAKENRSKKEIKFLYTKSYFPQLCDKEFLTQKYEKDLMSLPMIRKEFGIDFKSILFLLQYFGINKRNASKSCKLISAPKSRQTCLERYGKENVLCKGTEFFEKRNRTVKKRYGKDNVFQTQAVMDRIKSDAPYVEKYGKTFHEFRSMRSKQAWDSKTDEEKNEWLDKSIRSDKAYENNRTHKGYVVSKLEGRIQEILNELKITYTAQFCIKVSNRCRRFYDFLINECKTILEVNGDYWHCNPKMYKATDVVNFVYGKTEAQQIWNKDLLKKKLANDRGYKVVYIWEREILESKNKEDLRNLIAMRLNEVCGG